MHTAEINGITVEYHFTLGDEGDRDNAPTDHVVQILSLKIEGADAWAYVDQQGDSEDSYEFSATLAAIEPLVIHYHIFNR